MRITDPSVQDLPLKRPEGIPPTRAPKFVTALAHAWYDEAVEEGLDNPKVLPELPYRASDSSTRCDRALHYKLNDVVKSNPPGIADIWRFRTGHFIHAGVQKYVPRVAPNGRAEVEVDLRAIGIQGSGHADLVTSVCRVCTAGLELDDYWPMMLPAETRDVSVGDLLNPDTVETITEVIYACEHCEARTRWLAPGRWDNDVERADEILELKSQGGFGFKMMATTFKGPPTGPRYGHILQGALVGAVLDARRVYVGYLALENLSPSMAKDFADSEVARFGAEWIYDMATLMPYVEAEQKRVERLLRFRGTTMLPSRELHDPEYPVGATVTDPAPARGNAPWKVEIGGELRALGDTWMCSYCDFRDRCVTDGPS